MKTPILYREYTTASVLVMEYIDGIPIDHKEELLAGGYDLDEIGSKFVDILSSRLWTMAFSTQILILEM